MREGGEGRGMYPCDGPASHHEKREETEETLLVVRHTVETGDRRRSEGTLGSNADFALQILK